MFPFGFSHCSCSRIASLLLAVGCLVATERPCRAVGFAPGTLLVSSFRGGVRMIDPASGNVQTVLDTEDPLDTFGDVVYNPLTQSAFVVHHVPEAQLTPDVLEITWDAGAGFQSSVFLESLDSPSPALAIDSAGDVYFNLRRPQHTSDRIWKAGANAELQPASAVPTDPFAPGLLFKPQRMAFSPDGAQLYVTTLPENHLETVSLASGQVSVVTDAVQFPRGVDVAVDGSIYVAESDPAAPKDDHISIIPIGGERVVYAQQPWMEFLGSGFWADLEYDDRDGTLYAVKGNSLHAVGSDLSHRVVLTGFDPLDGLDLIEPARAAAIPGDYNRNGRVEQADLDLVLLHWGQPAIPVPAGWNSHVPNGHIDQDELDQVLLHWGGPAREVGGLLGSSVPEPGGRGLLAILLALAPLTPRPKLKSTLDFRPRSRL